MTDHEFYLGATIARPHEGDDQRVRHIYADMRLERSEPEAGWMDVFHRLHRAPLLSLAISFSVITDHRGFRPLDGSRSAGDRWHVAGGQVTPRERIIASRNGRTISDGDALLVQSYWHRYHLNHMRPGCLHTDGQDGQSPSYSVPSRVRLQSARTDWKLDNVSCPETGYRWGSAWLVEPLPDETVSVVERILATQ